MADGGIVKGIKSIELRYVKSPVWTAEAYCIEGAHQMVFSVFITIE